MQLSAYQRRFGYDAYERGQRMYAAQQVPPPRPPQYARHVGRTLGMYVHLVESQRVRGRMYRVTEISVNRFTCTCPDYRGKAPLDLTGKYQCKHVYVVRTDINNGVRPSRRLR